MSDIDKRELKKLRDQLFPPPPADTPDEPDPTRGNRVPREGTNPDPAPLQDRDARQLLRALTGRDPL